MAEVLKTKQQEVADTLRSIADQIEKSGNVDGNISISRGTMTRPGLGMINREMFNGHITYKINLETWIPINIDPEVEVEDGR